MSFLASSITGANTIAGYATLSDLPYLNNSVNAVAVVYDSDGSGTPAFYIWTGTHWARFGEPPAPGWNPLTKTGAVIYQDARLDVTYNGSNLVTSVLDQSTNSNDSAASTGHAPLFVPDAYGTGGHTLRFNGSSQYMTVGSNVTFPTTDTRSVWLLLKATISGPSTWITPLSLKTEIASTSFSANINNFAGYEDLAVYVTMTSVSGTRWTVDTTSGLCLLVMNYDGVAPNTPSSWDLVRNDTSQTRDTASASGSLNALNLLGSYPNSAPAFPFAGDIAAWGVYDTQMTTEEIASMLAWAQSIWTM